MASSVRYVHNSIIRANARFRDSLLQTRPARGNCPLVFHVSPPPIRRFSRLPFRSLITSRRRYSLRRQCASNVFRVNDLSNSSFMVYERARDEYTYRLTDNIARLVLMNHSGRLGITFRMRRNFATLNSKGSRFSTPLYISADCACESYNIAIIRLQE